MRRNANVNRSLVDRAQKRASRRSQFKSNARRLSNLFLNREHRFIHSGEASSFGRSHADIKLRFVNVRRYVFLLDDAIERHARRDDSDCEHRDDDAVVHCELKNPCITAVEPCVKSSARCG